MEGNPRLPIQNQDGGGLGVAVPRRSPCLTGLQSGTGGSAGISWSCRWNSCSRGRPLL